MKVLKIESLSKGWHDKDNIMLHACFQLLKDCVEKEKLFEHSSHYAKSKEGKMAKKLYDWWEVRKTKEYIFDTFEEDNAQLIKLIKIRSTLWT